MRVASGELLGNGVKYQRMKIFGFMPLSMAQAAWEGPLLTSCQILCELTL